MLMIAQLFAYTKNYWIAHPKRINYTVNKLYLNITYKKRKQLIKR